MVKLISKIILLVLSLSWMQSALAVDVLVGALSRVNRSYQSQIDNAFRPHSTCGITSLTMVVRFFGFNVTGDDMIQDYDYRKAQSNTTMGQILRDFGVHSRTFNTASRAELQQHLRAGRPIVLQNYFTRSGHIILIVGYNETGWIVHDPNGKWLGSPGSSPYKRGTGAYRVNGKGGPYYGKLTHYSYRLVEESEGGSHNYQGIAAYK